jgi:hypothetical protein
MAPWVCPRVPEPLADTITVTDRATGATVATETVGQGELASIPVPPGTYTVRAAPVGNLRPTIAQRTGDDPGRDDGPPGLLR